MGERLREVSEQELKKIILKETVFPTQLTELKNTITSQGIETHLFGFIWLDMTNNGELTESPGYYLQAADPYPHQLPLPDFKVENKHETAIRELGDFLRSMPDPRPCH